VRADQVGIPVVGRYYTKASAAIRSALTRATRGEQTHLDTGFARLSPRPVTRFAPSPTGHLHLGHVANAVWIWGIARALGGTVVLRMEDHDRGRCRAEFEASILEDLAWLGLHADAGEAELRAGGPCAFRQSDCLAHYDDALAQLCERANVYGCACSRKEIAARLPEAVAQRDEHPYDAYCRVLGLPQRPLHGVRVALPDEEVHFTDARLGPQRQRPAQQCGDLLLRERNGYWSYQFCVVVDDMRDGVNLVVRGTDILASTGRQILLARLLGAAAPPQYLHHPLILAEDGRKLSKREAAQGIRELRAAGAVPEAVLGDAAYRTGLIAVPRPLTAAELPGLFTA
jgi:glutamyl-Q tRNA(Asp) synthetase